jgi:hypothetical protein
MHAARTENKISIEEGETVVNGVDYRTSRTRRNDFAENPLRICADATLQTQDSMSAR